MEVVLHSFGKEEKLNVNGIEVIMRPGIPTVVPDKIGKRLLSRSDHKYLSVKDYKKWEKDAMKKKYKHFKTPPKPKKETKEDGGDKK